MTDYWVGGSCAVLVGAELLTGTFYLLAVGFAFAVGGVRPSSAFHCPYSWSSPHRRRGCDDVAHKWRGKTMPPPTPSLTSASRCACSTGWMTAARAVNYRGHAVERGARRTRRVARRDDVHRGRARVHAAHCRPPRMTSQRIE
jgi:hypothetical protein